MACSCDFAVALAYPENRAANYGSSPERRKHWPVGFPVTGHVHVLIPNTSQSLDVTKLDGTLPQLLTEKPSREASALRPISILVFASCFLSVSNWSNSSFMNSCLCILVVVPKISRSKFMLSGISSKGIDHQGGSSFTVSRIRTCLLFSQKVVKKVHGSYKRVAGVQ